MLLNYIKFYDVSVLISNDLPVWPGDPGVSVKLTSSFSKGDNVNVTHLKMGAHTGTHIDAPFHFEPDGKTIDQLSIETLIGPCRVIEMLDVKQFIGPLDLEKIQLDGVKRILFKTSNSKFWAKGLKEFQKGFIHISKEGAGYLVEKGIELVGIDYLSVEGYESPDHKTHHLLLRNQVVIVEGLNLSKVNPGDYDLIALPLNVKGADGAPARVILCKKTL